VGGLALRQQLGDDVADVDLDRVRDDDGRRPAIVAEGGAPDVEALLQVGLLGGARGLERLEVLLDRLVGLGRLDLDLILARLVLGRLVDDDQLLLDGLDLLALVLLGLDLGGGELAALIVDRDLLNDVGVALLIQAQAHADQRLVAERRGRRHVEQRLRRQLALGLVLDQLAGASDLVGVGELGRVVRPILGHGRLLGVLHRLLLVGVGEGLVLGAPLLEGHRVALGVAGRGRGLDGAHLGVLPRLPRGEVGVRAATTGTAAAGTTTAGTTSPGLGRRALLLLEGLRLLGLELGHLGVELGLASEILLGLVALSLELVGLILGEPVARLDLVALGRLLLLVVARGRRLVLLPLGRAVLRELGARAGLLELIQVELGLGRGLAGVRAGVGVGRQHRLAGERGAQQALVGGLGEREAPRRHHHRRRARPVAERGVGQGARRGARVDVLGRRRSVGIGGRTAAPLGIVGARLELLQGGGAAPDGTPQPGAQRGEHLARRVRRARAVGHRRRRGRRLRRRCSHLFADAGHGETSSSSTSEARTG
jgi:hypothetical protein